MREIGRDAGHASESILEDAAERIVPKRVPALEKVGEHLAVIEGERS
jgi:hypothetical protein